jgi:hypothetical protein
MVDVYWRNNATVTREKARFVTILIDTRNCRRANRYRFTAPPERVLALVGHRR